VVDLGPEGGGAGGEVVAEGPPEAVAAADLSYTGRWLRPLLHAKPAGTSPRATRRTTARGAMKAKARAKARA